MEAKELRVTNFVISDGVKMPVAMIGFDSVQLFTPQGNVVSARLDLIQPVPLNNQEILSMGFDRYQQTGHYKIEAHKYYANHDPSTLKQGYMRIKLTQAGNYRVESIASKSIYLRSVHQLQNLFYAITGNEMVFTPDLLTKTK